METKTYSPERVAKLLREVEAGQAGGETVEGVCRTLGVAATSYRRGKGRYGGMKAGEVRRPKGLERENERLEQLVAELSPDNKTLREAGRGNRPARRDAGRSSDGRARRWTSRGVASVRPSACAARWCVTPRRSRPDSRAR